MSGPKFQHWVPCGYLKAFAIGGEIKGRNTRVYVTTVDECRDKKVAKIGGENWTYSRSNPALDHEFNDMENDIPIIVNRLIDGELLTAKESLGFMLIVFDLHHRSAAYDNQTAKERFEAYQRVSTQWLALISPDQSYVSDMQKLCDYLSSNWTLMMIQPETSEKFVSSDHPSIIFTDSVDEKPILAVLPVTPSLCAMAYDSNRIDITKNKVTDLELGLLNGLQVSRCIKEVYSDHDLYEKGDAEIIKKLLTDPRPKRAFKEHSFIPDYYLDNSPAFTKLSFINKI